MYVRKSWHPSAVGFLVIAELIKYHWSTLATVPLNESPRQLWRHPHSRMCLEHPLREVSEAQNIGMTVCVAWLQFGSQDISIAHNWEIWDRNPGAFNRRREPITPAENGWVEGICDVRNGRSICSWEDRLNCQSEPILCLNIWQCERIPPSALCPTSGPTLWNLPLENNHRNIGHVRPRLWFNN